MTNGTTWALGPTFANELVAAGVSLEGYGWDVITGEFFFMDFVPQHVRDQVAAVVAAHDPLAQTDPPTLPWPPIIVPGEPPVVWMLGKDVILQRLEQARKLDEFFQALDNASRLQRELWHALPVVRSDNAMIIALIRAAEADPLVILAR